MIGLRPAKVDEIVLIGAHCDDLAIGLGGTLLALAQARPGLRVHALVCTGAGTPREVEEHRALQAFCPQAQVKLQVLDLPDGRLPSRRADVKSAIRALAESTEPDIVFAPHSGDAHQDHRLLGELALTEFRDHLHLGYEILKWESDLPAVNAYQTLSSDQAQAKADLLAAHYPSQTGRHWFDREAFLGLARIRGVQNHTRYAEGFVVTKLSLDLPGAADEGA